MITRRDCLLRGMRLVAAGVLLAPAIARAAEAEPAEPRQARLRPRQALPPEAFAASVRFALVSGETRCHLLGDTVRITAANADWNPAQRGFAIMVNYDQLKPGANRKRLRMAIIGPDGAVVDEELFALPEAVAGKQGPLGLVSTASSYVVWSTRQLSPERRVLDLSWVD